MSVSEYTEYNDSIDTSNDHIIVVQCPLVIAHQNRIISGGNDDVTSHYSIIPNFRSYQLLGRYPIIDNIDGSTLPYGDDYHQMPIEDNDNFNWYGLIVRLILVFILFAGLIALIIIICTSNFSHTTQSFLCMGIVILLFIMCVILNSYN